VTVFRRAHGRTARRIAVLALTAPLSAALVLTTAGPAAASSVAWTSPTPPNGEILSGSSVQLKATLSVSARESASASLKLTPPSGSSYSYGPWSCTGGTFGGAKCDSQMSPVNLNGDNRPNGAWTATINGGFARVFYTNFKPTADPANLAASAVGRTEVDLSWQYSGSEPDKAGFEIVETHNGASRSIIAPASSCSGSTCGYALTYEQPAYDTTETYSYSVTALRSSGCSSCGDFTRSNTVSGATAQLVGPPPPPSPTPTPSDGSTGGTTTGDTTTGSTGSTTGSTGSTTGTTGGTTTGGSSTGGATTGGTTGGSSTTGHTAGKPIAVPSLPPIVASRKAFALGFNKFSPSLGIPKLPPLPAITAPTVGAGNDTYAPTLPYKGGSSTKKTTSVLSSPISAVTSLDTTQLANLIAIGLLLLVSAAHVRRFITATDDD
jgi:hypothetical protein